MTGPRNQAATVGAALAVFLASDDDLVHARAALHNAQRQRANAVKALVGMLGDRERVFIGGKLITRIGASIHVEHGVRAL